MLSAVEIVLRTSLSWIVLYPWLRDASLVYIFLAYAWRGKDGKDTERIMKMASARSSAALFLETLPMFLIGIARYWIGFSSSLDYGSGWALAMLAWFLWIFEQGKCLAESRRFFLLSADDDKRPSNKQKEILAAMLFYMGIAWTCAMLVFIAVAWSTTAAVVAWVLIGFAGLVSALFYVGYSIDPREAGEDDDRPLPTTGKVAPESAAATPYTPPPHAAVTRFEISGPSVSPPETLYPPVTIYNYYYDGGKYYY
ncbi:hypothetical protein GPECTOR_27g683 [Gonium pectorale]|uniref:Uncharacterized protein n=1 Tax=Gonium pectorale TaxID=33097 RepID=A0A150GF88_GONPE|nr:hypothetical protein GPECTOR_27g683 [Gonium pectorale]|eukprot:KXZ48512.1 hypothetical protein GPECTOR_27g683 [Gonium pectorale]